VKFACRSATRHNSPNSPPTSSSPLAAAALTTVRESCKRERSYSSERTARERSYGSENLARESVATAVRIFQERARLRQ
jgi:hypothetical protein